MSSKNIWTSAKVEKLIALYKTNKCLWNFHTEEYKNRKLRETAIENICQELGITKLQYVKKIHNLRNQINFELRKRQKSEVGNIIYTGKWEFFESLLFLTKFISYRVGNQDPMSETSYADKHDSIEPDQNSVSADNAYFLKSEETIAHSVEYEQQLQSPAAAEEQTVEEEEEIEPEHEYVEEEIEEEPQQVKSNKRERNSQSELIVLHDQQSMPALKKVHLSSSSRTDEPVTTIGGRDECKTFGEFVANELQSLSSNLLRKRMKRRIMQAILDVANEDDETA